MARWSAMSLVLLLTGASAKSLGGHLSLSHRTLHKNRAQVSHKTGAAHTFRPVTGMQNMREAKNMCISVTDDCHSLQKEEDEDLFIAKRLKLHPIPKGYEGAVMPEGLLLTKKMSKIKEDFKLVVGSDLRTKNYHYDAKMLEAAEDGSLFPIFSDIHAMAMTELKSRNQKSVAPNTGATRIIDTVIMPQVESKHTYASQRSDWYDSMVDVLLEEGKSTDFKRKGLMLQTTAAHEDRLFCENIKQSPGGQMCFKSLYHYKHDDARVNSNKLQYFPTVYYANALQERMLAHHKLEKSQDFSHKALLVIREDLHGWRNHKQVEVELKKLLKRRCWSAHVMTVGIHDNERDTKKKVELFKDADLVIANHGAENQNMAFMKTNAGFIEDKNCLCSEYGFGSLASQRGLQYRMTFGDQHDRERDCKLAQISNMGRCSANVPRMVQFETEIRPHVEDLLNQLESDKSRGPACKGQHIMDEHHGLTSV